MGEKPAKCYRYQDRPAYTRREYIKGAPDPRIRIFDMGNKGGKFEYAVHLVVLERGQIRDRALEAARVAAHNYLREHIGLDNYHLRIRVYPHHVLREHKLLGAAKAERLQKGMRLAFGKPVGRAARVRRFQEIITVYTNERYLDEAKEALRRAKYKVAMPCKIVVEKLS